MSNTRLSANDVAITSTEQGEGKTPKERAVEFHVCLTNAGYRLFR